MICIICDCEVLKRDGFYWEYDDETKEKIGPVHDDCALREDEFRGDHTSAARTFAESQEFYNHKSTKT